MNSNAARSMTVAPSKAHVALPFDASTAAADLLLSGSFNHRIGWLLMAGAFVWAAWWDPAVFQNFDHMAAPENRQIFLRHAQTMLVEIAFLQLVVAQVIAWADFSMPLRRSVSWLTAAGAAISAVGYTAAAQWANGSWLIILGSLVGAGGFTLTALIGFRRQDRHLLRMITILVAFGMLLEAAATLIELQPGWLWATSYLGPQDGIRLRMARLARVAALGLPVLTFLYRGLAFDSPRPAARWGMVAMAAGAFGMPAVLTAASLTYVDLKVLLPIPSCALLAATMCAARLAVKRTRSRELWGWLMIAFTMTGGMIMGLYAFLTPEAAPNGLAGYNDEMRRLIRLGHGYGVVFGLLQIFVAREPRRCAGMIEFGMRLLLAGGFITTTFILVLSLFDLPRGLLSVGPAMVAFSILIFAPPRSSPPAQTCSFVRRALGGES